MKGETAQKPLFIIIRGLPGAGKSVLVDQLLELPLFAESLRLDPEIPLKRKTYRYLLRQAEKALREGRSVVWEQPHFLRSGRNSLVDVTLTS